MSKLPISDELSLPVLVGGANGKPINRNDLDEPTGYKRSSRDVYLSRLAAKRLVETPGSGLVQAAGAVRLTFSTTISTTRCVRGIVNVAMTQKSPLNQQDHHTEREWQRKFFGMGAHCYYCQKPLLLKEATKDHLTPSCRGGSDKISNIVPACLPCNQMKGWRTESEFYAARPSLAKYSQARAAKDKPKAQLSLDERVNEYGLLKKVTGERERVSWFWSHPA